MKKIQMLKETGLTFKAGCEKYLDDCRQRNLREGTIRHYRQSYTQFYKVIPAGLPLEDFTEKSLHGLCEVPHGNAAQRC